MLLHNSLFLICFFATIIFSASSVYGRSIYLNGVDVSSARNQFLKNVNLRIDENGNIYIEAPHYQINEENIKLRDELRESEKMKAVATLAAGMAHEIKNPLTGIANAIEIIVQEMHENEKKPVLEEIQRQIRRVNKTINDLLQFSRTVELYLEPGNINEIIKSVNFFLENQIRDKNITFVLNLQPDLPTFSFDHKHMENALINLGLNAIQAIEECGTVHISTIYNPEKKKVIIQIKDTGVGIPKENVSKIFRPFFTTRHKGTGLGLAITKEIIEKHNGTISVQCLFSKGSIFTILIPLQ